MKRRIFIVTLLALTIAGYAFALGTPDFSGTWTLDHGKSDMGMPRPAAGQAPMRTVTIVIKQTRTTLSIERKVGDKPETAVLKLDGAESTNKAPSGNDIKSTSTWAGATLVTKSTMDMEGTKIQMTDVRSLSADGKVMTIDVVRQTPRGETRQKLIYNKQ